MHSPSADEGHDFDLIAFIQRSVVAVAFDESAVEFDGDFFGSHVELFDEGSDGDAFGDFALLAVHLDLHHL